jgi:uncharacterized protein YndB with AHSA1/START domain
MDDENVLTIHRTLAASRDRVWRACTEPSTLAKWWGLPKGASMPVVEVDLCVGGSFHFKVDLPDGTSLWFKSIYREIVDGQKLILESHLSDENGNIVDTADMPVSMITLLFEDSGARTELTVIHEGMTSAAHQIDQYKEGWSQSLDRLTGSLIN